METLSLSSRPARSSASPVSGAVYVLDHTESPAKPAAKIKPRPLPEVIEHDRAIMRDLVLGAFLGAQHFREDDGKFVGQYTTENTREAFPAHLEALRECRAEDGDHVGRLPAAYVASLAKGTTRVIASETRPKKKASIPLGPLAFQDAHVVRAVAGLPPELQHWIRYAYADSKVWDDEAGAVAALWARHEPTLGKIQAKTLQKVRSLAHLAVQDVKLAANCGKVLHQPARLQQLLGVTVANWDKHWAGRWQALRETLLELDREALTALCKAMRGYGFVLLDRGL
ncbi:bacteriophage antitermination protein Q [Pseudomonas aeruginosa]|uniref:bacteriophage antitermination protein Q n=1 Tax=Pseudomonas aeruginosa TaxID=287 RepID=UPI000B48A447|nr:bacteriophage antitermination protein Q [Pseudomonas aeruginosa]OWI91734.1 hypothetical protein CDC19_23695 [Pseudomonas aeruginosa]